MIHFHKFWAPEMTFKGIESDWKPRDSIVNMYVQINTQ